MPKQTSRSKLCNALAFRNLASPRIQGLPRVERRRARVRARQADIRASEAVLNVGVFRKNQAKNPDAYCQALKLFAARATSFSTAQSHDMNWSRGLSSRRCSKPPVQKAAREALTHPGESGPAGPAHGAEQILRCAFAALTAYKVRGLFPCRWKVLQ